MVEHALKARIAELEKELAKEKATARVTKISGIAPTAVEDVVRRVLERFDIGDDMNLRVKPMTATVSWESPESLVEGLRGSHTYLFDNAASRWSGEGRSGGTSSNFDNLLPEAKIALGNEQNRPKGY